MGASIGLNLIEGTRALVGWIHEDRFELVESEALTAVQVSRHLRFELREIAHEDEQDLVDGWISFVRLDGSPTLRRVLEEFRT